MLDWYSEGLARMLGVRRWVHWYAVHSGHFVDDFGNMVSVYLPDEHGFCRIVD